MAFVMANDILGSRPLRRPIFDQLSQFVDVLRGHRLRHSHVLGDAQRDSQLVQIKIGIGRNDRSSRKIDSFTHKISAQTSFFALESTSDALDCLARLVLLLWLARNVVVHQS